MLVKEVMTKNVVTIDRNKTIFDACNLYKDKKIGCLLVTDEGRCVGIATERNIIERTICSRIDPYETKIGDIMSTDLVTVHALDKIETAIEYMEFFEIKKLPVLVNDEIVGIITALDIAKARPDLSDRFVDTWVKARWKD
ncbi:MAG: CBS domain-containing protein [Thermoplasmatales archaeon]|nr:CBS domain-containing protein [Thermoplasmatales archaeon]